MCVLLKLDGLYITNSALFMKFNNLPLSAGSPYHVLKLKAEDLLQVKHAVLKESNKNMNEQEVLSVAADEDEMTKNEEVPTLLKYLDTLRILSGQ